MQPSTRLRGFAFVSIALSILTTVFSIYFLARFASNPFELDFTDPWLVRMKLRVPYYATIVSIVLTSVLALCLTDQTRHRLIVLFVCFVVGYVVGSWATQSVSQLWADLGGEGLP